MRLVKTSLNYPHPYKKAPPIGGAYEDHSRGPLLREGLVDSFLLLVQSQVDGNSDGNGSTYHRVVTNTQEAHHLNVSGH